MKVFMSETPPATNQTVSQTVAPIAVKLRPSDRLAFDQVPEPVSKMSIVVLCCASCTVPPANTTKSPTLAPAKNVRGSES